MNEIMEAEQSYLDDKALFIIWKYLNAQRFTDKSSLTFKDITPVEMSVQDASVTFLKTLSDLGIKLNNATLHQERIYIPPNYKGEKYSQIKLEPRHYDAFGIEDLKGVQTLFGSSFANDYLEFNTKLSKDTLEKLQNFLGQYIRNFIKDNLKIDDRNFYVFEMQRRALMGKLERQITSYGKRFVIQNMAHETYRGRHKEFLFVHTLIALEKLGYYKIEDIWIVKAEPDSYTDANDSYGVRMSMIKTLYEENTKTDIQYKPKVVDQKSSQNEIRQITFVERPVPNSPSHYTFYINKDMKNIRLLRGDSSRIKKIILLAKSEDIEYDKNLVDYINSNLNCALYCAGKYKLTRVIEKHGKALRFCMGIEAKVISETNFKKEKNKQEVA